MRDTGAVRAFVAVAIPDAAAEIVRGLDRPALRQVRWTTPEQWHVTVRFLGEVADPAPLAAALGAVPTHLRARHAGTVRAELGPASAWFPGRQVLQVPVAGLDALAAVVDEVVSPWCAPSDYPFTGHLTLARVRGRARGPASLAGTPVAAAWVVEEVALMSSTLEPGGARHRVESVVALR